MKKKFGTLFQRMDCGGNWYYQWYVDGKRKRTALGTKDKDEAEKIFNSLSEQLAAAKVTGTVEHVMENFVEMMEPGTKAKKRAEEELAAYAVEQEKLKRRIPLVHLYDYYIEDRKRPPSASTLKDYKGYVKHLTEFLKRDYPDITCLEEITVEMVYGFEKHVDHLSPSTFRKVFNTMRHFVKIFMKTEKYPLLISNVFNCVENKRLITNSKRPLSEAEIIKLINTAEGDLKLLTMFGIFTGLRMGDCSSIDWSSISMSKRCIILMPSKTAKYQKKSFTPLHPALYRELESIPMAERMGYVLKEYGPLYEKHGSWKISDKFSEHLISCGIKPASFKRVNKIKDEATGELVVHKALNKETVMPFKNRISKVGFHSLRHSFISLSAEGGGDLVAIQELTAHSSPEMQRVYLAASEQQAENAVNALPSFDCEMDPQETELIKPEIMPDDEGYNGMSSKRLIKIIKMMNKDNVEDMKDMILD